MKKDFWVRNKNTGKLNFVTDSNSHYYKFEEGVRDKPIENYENWKPSNKEWCWFWRETSEVPVLDQFGKKHICKDGSGVVYYTVHSDCFNRIEPFIGELPTVYKKQENIQ